jgi:hypothetical protein
MKITNVPLTWTPALHKNLHYEITPIKDPAQNSIWQAAGHDLDKITMYVHYFDGIYPWMEYLSIYFTHLDFVKFGFNKIPPGHYLPSHRDLYGFYKSQINVNISKIQRYIIFLEDWYDGQFATVEDQTFTNWKVGDMIGWVGDDLHSAANLGINDRYTLQITGVLK